MNPSPCHAHPRWSGPGRGLYGRAAAQRDNSTAHSGPLDLSPQAQAALVDGRANHLIPSAAALAEKIEAAQAAGRPFVVKYGIDPTSHDVHLGHAVPIIIASRFQRMGHHVVFIIGDVTAKIGDPSGRSSERPPLTDEDIARNLSGYQQQVTSFIDFERADLRFNGE